MQFLCLTVIIFLLTVVHCATEITPFDAIGSLFTLKLSSGKDSYPFCAWPANVTSDECDSNISLLCVIHDCSHGPRIVVGNHTFDEANGLTTSCIHRPDSELLTVIGTWIAHLRLNISDIAQDWSSNEPIPMYCATFDHKSEEAYLSIPENCQSPTPSIYTSSSMPTHHIQTFLLVFTFILSFVPLLLHCTILF